MARKAHVDFRGRRALRQFLLRIKHTSVREWPEQLSDAWDILKEKGVSPAKARTLVLESISAAHRYMGAQNELLNFFEQAKTRIAIQRACRKISNCIKRAPAKLRHRLDQAIFPLIKEPLIDLEVIESILEIATMVFEAFPESEPSKAAAKALLEVRARPFSMLSVSLRSQVEKALAAAVIAAPEPRATKSRVMTSPIKQFANFQPVTASHGKHGDSNSVTKGGAGKKVTKSHAKHSAQSKRVAASHISIAGNVFAIIASVLADGTKNPSTNTGNLLIRYVADLAEIWRQRGLKPSRAVSFLNPKYRIRFHRFAELILAAMADPRTEGLASGELIGDNDVRAALQPNSNSRS